MARLKAWLRSPQSRYRLGAVRLAVLCVVLILIGAALFVLSRRSPVAAETARTAVAPASKTTLTSKKGCACQRSADIKGVRLHYTQTAGGTFRLAQTSGGDGSGADVIIPDEARWDALVVSPGEQITLATTSPLPVGEDMNGGAWTATFGAETDNGDGTLTYTAPSSVPPYNLDEVDYSPGAATGGPSIQLMVSVRGTDQSQAASRGGKALLHLAAAVVPDCQAQATVEASVKTLRSVPTDIRGNYAKTVRWLKLEQGNSPRMLRLAQATTASGNGYLLPAWVDNKSVQLYTPTVSPSGVVRNPPVVCKKPGPVGEPPPYPSPTGPCNCKPGDPYHMPNDGLPHWQQNPPSWSGWSTVATLDESVSLSVQDKIENAGGSVGADGKVHTRFRSRSVFYTRVRYIDHYRCADSGRNWVYISTTKCVQNGNGMLFDPTWVRYIRDWPANGDCPEEKFVPNPPSCKEIHSQQH